MKASFAGTVRAIEFLGSRGGGQLRHVRKTFLTTVTYRVLCTQRIPCVQRLEDGPLL